MSFIGNNSIISTLQIEYLVVGGGGAGGAGAGLGGGGGAGGLLQGFLQFNKGSTLAVAVGEGGVAPFSYGNDDDGYVVVTGTSGSESVLGNLIAFGGGRGASGYVNPRSPAEPGG